MLKNTPRRTALVACPDGKLNLSIEETKKRSSILYAGRLRLVKALSTATITISRRRPMRRLTQSSGLSTIYIPAIVIINHGTP